jgi:short-subunit dehydrogenase
MNIVITGASKGIGKEIAKVFSRQSNHKILLIARDLKLLEGLKKQCLTLNPECEVSIFSFDLNNSEGLEKLAGSIINQVDKIDVLINNAGQLFNKKFGEMTENEIFSTFNVNFFSPVMLIRYLIPALKKAGKSHVVNIGSMGGFQGSSKYSGLSYYSASKAALGVMTECLAEEYKHTQISFNCLALGAVQTEMFSEAFPGAVAPVQAYEMAEYIVDFALMKGHGMNGKIIPVNL